MDIFYLISAVFLNATVSIFGGFYNRKNEGKENVSMLYSMLLFPTVFLFWIIMFLFEGGANVRVLPYSLLYAFFYITCAIATVEALKTGPIILTSLMLQLSCILVAIWGFVFWNAPVTPLVIVGLVLVAISLWLCLYSGKAEKKKSITPKWLFFIAVVFFGNAGCAIVQRTQQNAFHGAYGNFLMMSAMGFALIACAIIYFFSNKEGHKTIIKKSGIYPILTGVCNGILNLCMILLASSKLSTSLIYPVCAVGGLAVTTMFSAFVFKEKMQWWQWIGIAIGAVAVAFLSI